MTSSPPQLILSGRATPPPEMASPPSSLSHSSLPPQEQPSSTMGPPPRPNSSPQRVVRLYGEVGSPSSMGPPQTGPPQMDPPQTNPSQMGPPQTNTPQMEPPQMNPPQAGTPQMDSSQTDSPQMNPPQTGHARMSPRQILSSPPRRSDPSAANYLWACQLRLEHVELVDKYDRINQTLATVANTVEGLQHLATVLQGHVQKLHDDGARTFAQLGTFQGATVEETRSLTRMVEGLVYENNVLRARVDALTRDALDRDEKLRTEVMNEVRMVVRAEMECLKGQIDVGESRKPKEPDTVPGSMPVDSAGSDSRQDLSTQEFSQTTFGGSTLEDVLSVSRHAVLLPALKQEGRNLVEYFEFAEGFRAQLPPQSRESVFVETFLEGLEDTEAKSFLQSQANNDGWTWDAMSTALRQLGGKRVEDEQAQSNMAKQGTAGKSGQSSKAPATGARARRRGRKRRISIVSTDGEDIV